MVLLIHDAAIRCTYDDEPTAAVVERAIAPEVGTIEGDRSRTDVSRDGATLVLRIEAEDARALRAAKNTWFSLLLGAEGGVDAARVPSGRLDGADDGPQ